MENKKSNLLRLFNTFYKLETAERELTESRVLSVMFSLISISALSIGLIEGENLENNKLIKIKKYNIVSG